MPHAPGDHLPSSSSEFREIWIICTDYRGILLLRLMHNAEEVLGCHGIQIVLRVSLDEISDPVVSDGHPNTLTILIRFITSGLKQSAYRRILDDRRAFMSKAIPHLLAVSLWSLPRSIDYSCSGFRYLAFFTVATVLLSCDRIGIELAKTRCGNHTILCCRLVHSPTS
jgi:hypothetical protein